MKRQEGYDIVPSSELGGDRCKARARSPPKSEVPTSRLQDMSMIRFGQEDTKLARTISYRAKATVHHQERTVASLKAYGGNSFRIPL